MAVLGWLRRSRAAFIDLSDDEFIVDFTRRSTRLGREAGLAEPVRCAAACVAVGRGLQSCLAVIEYLLAAPWQGAASSSAAREGSGGCGEVGCRQAGRVVSHGLSATEATAVVVESARVEPWAACGRDFLCWCASVVGEAAGEWAQASRGRRVAAAERARSAVSVATCIEVSKNGRSLTPHRAHISPGL